jgi:K+-sensing histidine kinase KdpD
VAAELAIGVEYTQLHSLTDERLRRKIIELGTLQRVSRTVASALDLNDVLRFVSESAVELTNAESAAVFRLPSHGKGEESAPLVEYRVGAARQVSDQASRDALLSDVINSGSARAVDMDYVDGTNILYCMPLSSARERWGALCVRLKAGMEVTEDDLALLQAFTDTASIAIENAELYEEAPLRCYRRCTTESETTCKPSLPCFRSNSARRKGATRKNTFRTRLAEFRQSLRYTTS